MDSASDPDRKYLSSDADQEPACVILIKNICMILIKNLASDRDQEYLYTFKGQNRCSLPVT